MEVVFICKNNNCKVQKQLQGFSGLLHPPIGQGNVFKCFFVTLTLVFSTVMTSGACQSARWTDRGFPWAMWTPHSLSSPAASPSLTASASSSLDTSTSISILVRTKQHNYNVVHKWQCIKTILQDMNPVEKTSTRYALTGKVRDLKIN